MLNLVASYKMRTRQIHRGLGARGCANPKGRGAGDGKYAAVAADTLLVELSNPDLELQAQA